MIAKLKPWMPSIILLPITLFLIFNKGNFIFLVDHVNLLFHEGGHGIFSLFGKFLYTLGGSIMQVLIPVLFIFYFLTHKQRIGVQLSLVYLAQNLMNIGVYAADARAHRLPLIGGNKVYHDWTYLLGKMKILEYDQTVGSVLYFIAIAVIFFALLLPLFMKDYNKANLNLKL